MERNLTGQDAAFSSDEVMGCREANEADKADKEDRTNKESHWQKLMHWKDFKKRRRKIDPKKAAWAILKLLILLGIIVGITLYIYFYHHEFITQMSSVDGVKAFFRQYRGESVLIYIAAQIIQVVVCVIPGQWLQIAAGLAWGFWGALALSLAGAAAGSVIAYFLAGILGRDAMHLFFGEEKFSQYVERLNSKKAWIVTFLVYLIPGLPKDLCCYVAGISEMKLRPFLIVSLIGRIPGMTGSILIGTQVASRSWNMVIIIAAIFLVLFILGVIYRKRLLAWLDKVYVKMME